MTKVFYFCLTLILAILLWLAIAWEAFLSTPIIPANKPAVGYTLQPGSSARTLAKDLTQMGLLPHPYFLIALAYYKGYAHKLQAGEYLFAPNIKPSELLQQIATGKVVYHNFTIVEGWTFKQVLDALHNNPAIAQTSLTGMPVTKPEGQFFPSTYRFTKGMSDTKLLQMAYNLMQKQLSTEWAGRADGLPYKTPYEALIAASLVEKETAQANERPIIAGVLMRRLEKNMPLQIDSSVIYGLGNQYTGRLQRSGLQADTPYNTYLYLGLPPTPIAMPSLASIHAVLHPDNSNLLYFVARGDGTHIFSENLQEQNQAVQVYQIDPNYPKVGLMNGKSCRPLWYVSKLIQGLLC